MAQTSTLPAPIESESPAPAPSPTTTTLAAPQPLGLDLGAKKVDSRDALIGVAVLVVLAILFFVIKNAYANWRVRERVAPSRANASGWFLFLGLMAVAAGTVLGFVNSGRFLAPLYLIPLGGLALVSLVAWLATFSAKR